MASSCSSPTAISFLTRWRARSRNLLESDLTPRLVKGRAIGRASRDEDATTRYIEFAKRTLPRDTDLAGLRVVLDCANGAAYKSAPVALWELGR